MELNELAEEFAKINSLTNRIEEFTQRDEFPKLKESVIVTLASENHTSIMNTTIHFLSSLIMLTFKTANDPVYENALSFCRNLIKNNATITRDATCMFVELTAIYIKNNIEQFPELTEIHSAISEVAEKLI